MNLFTEQCHVSRHGKLWGWLILLISLLYQNISSGLFFSDGGKRLLCLLWSTFDGLWGPSRISIYCLLSFSSMLLKYIILFLCHPHNALHSISSFYDIAYALSYYTTLLSIIWRLPICYPPIYYPSYLLASHLPCSYSKKFQPENCPMLAESPTLWKWNR